KPGEGTCFSVLFPLCSSGGSKPQAITDSAERVLPVGDEKILVVDDEEPVRNVLSKSLSHLGYQVEVAENGEQAIEKYVQTVGHYDLVILDMLMPQLSGEQVFFSLKEHNPEVAVLVISGFTSEESVNRILENGGKGFIQKPFTIEALAKKVRECVE
ncbi:MAG: response regulator, partial [Bdellovibrionales bacterium]|nr:response regulator [Bdellovibrionales bacterium]